MKSQQVFRPQLWDTIKSYNKDLFMKDLMAGLIVGIVALPLAIAFGIASGVSPEKGLCTAVIAGFLISMLGGSRVQIGGPTGAFIIIVYGIVETYGIHGLIIATFMAGVMLILMGLLRLGSVIKYIPHPLITGFTTGIALIIFSSQIKDMLGLDIKSVPAGFVDQWKSFGEHIHSINLYAVILCVSTVAVVALWQRVTTKIPGSLVAIFLTTAAMQLLNIPVETIGSRFGELSFSFPSPSIPPVDFNNIRNLIQPAFTIALLGGIESLLSAVVADGMTGGRHRSNTELIAQGTANIFTSIFGGIPATGAIARTATNIRNGGRTPIAGMIHSIVLLLIMLLAAQWAALIPMATLAGILIVVAYNMSEWRSFFSMLKGPRSDALVLVITFFLTVLVDLTAAIEIGMILAILLFMRKMILYSNVSLLEKESDNNTDLAVPAQVIPPNTEVFEITGPLFFGAAYKFKEAIRSIDRPSKILIIRMRQVPIIDATGIQTLQEIHKETKQQGTRLILTEIHSRQVMDQLRNARLLFAIGKANVTDTFEQALARCGKILHELNTSIA